MVECGKLAQYLHALLAPDAVRDYCPNGLQVSGGQAIGRLVTGVTATQALIAAAIETQADALLVHHGLFWRGDSPCVVGPLRARLAALLAHDIHLFAYHLPLDNHVELGNNAQFARILGLQAAKPCQDVQQPAPIWTGRLPEAMAAAALQAHLRQVLQQAPLHLPGGPSQITDVAWCTGAAHDGIVAAAALGCQAYISGEVSERTTHLAAELGIHYFAAGHHATERYGIKALGEHLAEVFALEHQFIDIPNPV